MIETETWFSINWLMIYKDLKYKLHYRVYKLNYCFYWNIHSNTGSYSVCYILYETYSETRTVFISIKVIDSSICAIDRDIAWTIGQAWSSWMAKIGFPCDARYMNHSYES